MCKLLNKKYFKNLLKENDFDRENIIVLFVLDNEIKENEELQLKDAFDGFKMLYELSDVQTLLEEKDNIIFFFEGEIFSVSLSYCNSPLLKLEFRKASKEELNKKSDCDYIFKDDYAQLKGFENECNKLKKTGDFTSANIINYLKIYQEKENKELKIESKNRNVFYEIKKSLSKREIYKKYIDTIVHNSKLLEKDFDKKYDKKSIHKILNKINSRNDYTKLEISYISRQLKDYIEEFSSIKSKIQKHLFNENTLSQEGKNIEIKNDSNKKYVVFRQEILLCLFNLTKIKNKTEYNNNINWLKMCQLNLEIEIDKIQQTLINLEKKDKRKVTTLISKRKVNIELEKKIKRLKSLETSEFSNITNEIDRDLKNKLNDLLSIKIMNEMINPLEVFLSKYKEKSISEIHSEHSNKNNLEQISIETKKIIKTIEIIEKKKSIILAIKKIILLRENDKKIINWIRECTEKEIEDLTIFFENIKLINLNANIFNAIDVLNIKILEPLFIKNDQLICL